MASRAPLPDPDAPVTVENRDGKLFVALPSREEAEQIVHRAKRRLADLPALPDSSNPIACVVAYELFGLGIDDIAVALGISVTQVNTIKNHDAYKLIRKSVIENIKNEGKEEVLELFKSHRMKAAQNMIDFMDHGRPNVAMKATETVLQASGINLKPDHKDSGDPMKSGLTIVYVEGDKDKNTPLPDVKLTIDG